MTATPDSEQPCAQPCTIPLDPLEGASPRRRAANILAQRILVPLAVALAVIVLVFYVLFDHSRVAGPSMLPTLQNGDFILLTKGLARPRRGDVIVLDTVEQGRATELVKRIVALGGDRVHIAGDFVLVNGAPEVFPHTVYGDTGRAWPIADLTVPRGMVYALGDNRPVSYDSRYLGPFPVGHILGKVVAVYAPFYRIGLVAGP